MRTFYRLLNYELASMFRAAALLCLGAFLTPVIFAYSAVSSGGIFSAYQRFEALYVSSGSMIIFFIYFIALCMLFLKTIYTNYWGSKSIYTLLTLPVRREALYFSRLIAFAICLFMLWIAQLLGVLVFHDLASSYAARYEEGQFVMSNSLFLGFIRSEFLRLLLPMNIAGVISTMSLALVALTGTYYGALCERSRRYWGWIFIGLALWFSLKVLQLRMRTPSFFGADGNLDYYSVVLFGCSGFFIWHSLRLIKRGAIA